MAADLSSLIGRLEAVTMRLESAAGGGGGGAAMAPAVTAAFVAAFDDILNGQFSQFIACSNRIGGDVKTLADMVQGAFHAQREFLTKAAQCKQPDQSSLAALLKPTSEKISAIQEFRESSRKSAFFNHLSTISESIPALGWVAKPPKCELDGKKWIVEYQKGNKDIVISDTSNKQTVYIFKCEDSTVQVKGKVNSITLDGCKKTAVVFENAIASLEMINCQRIQCQVTGKVPTVSIDKTDGCQIYLSKDSLKTEIVSAKSSEMNVLVPDSSGEFKEYALPEQFKTIWGGKKFNTTATDING